MRSGTDLRRPVVAVGTAALLTTLLTACDVGDDPTVVPPSTGTGTQSVPDDRRAVAERLAEDLAAVVAAQEGIDAPVQAALSALREADDVVAGMRSTATIEAAEAAQPAASAALATVTLEGVRPDLVALADAVDAARSSVAAAQAFATPEEVVELAAEDTLLLAVRELAARTDALVQVVELQLPLYGEALALVATEVEFRPRYRSLEEAVAAFEVAAGDVIGRLAEAQVLLARFREERDVAALDVNAASAAVDRARDEEVGDG